MGIPLSFMGLTRYNYQALASYMADMHATDEALHVATMLHRSVLGLSRRLRDARRTNQLSTSRLTVLALLRRDSPISPTDLANRLRIQPQSLTRLLADLQAGDLVRRAADVADRRRNMVEITPAGLQALASDTDERRARLAEAIEAELTPSERDMIGIAARLVDRLSDALTIFKT